MLVGWNRNRFLSWPWILNSGWILYTIFCACQVSSCAGSLMKIEDTARIYRIAEREIFHHPGILNRNVHLLYGTSELVSKSTFFFTYSFLIPYKREVQPRQDSQCNIWKRTGKFLVYWASPSVRKCEADFNYISLQIFPN